VGAGASAHEGHPHDTKGTIQEISEAKLVLKTTEGTEQSFALSASTKFRRGAKEAKREEAIVGERAVVIYETKDGADRAIEIRLAEKKP
jgi:hypothetical protein